MTRYLFNYDDLVIFGDKTTNAAQKRMNAMSLLYWRHWFINQIARMLMSYEENNKLYCN